MIADAAGAMSCWNAAARLFGRSADEAIGRETMATGHTICGDRLFEVPALQGDGRNLSIAFTVSLVRDSLDGARSAIVAVLRDDTERWQERRRLRGEVTALREGEPTAST